MGSLDLRNFESSILLLLSVCSAFLLQHVLHDNIIEKFPKHLNMVRLLTFGVLLGLMLVLSHIFHVPTSAVAETAE
jgi:hypothetical protein